MWDVNYISLTVFGKNAFISGKFGIESFQCNILAMYEPNELYR